MEPVNGLSRNRREDAGRGGWQIAVGPLYGHDFILATVRNHLKFLQWGLMQSDRGFEEMAWEEGWSPSRRGQAS